MGVVFWAFRVMVALGPVDDRAGSVGRLAVVEERGPERSRLFLRLCVAMGPAGFIAVIAGWTVAEVGRQPWVVFGQMRTENAVSPIGAGEVSASLIAFLLVYAVVFSAGALYILRLIAEGPVAGAAEPPPIPQRAPGSPLAAAPEEEAP